MAERRCQGEKGSISEAVCHARQERRYHKCAECEWRDRFLQPFAARAVDDPRHKVFRSDEILGLYPQEVDEKLAELIGVAVGRFLNAPAIVLGRDARPSSESLARAVAEGLLTSGCDVLDLGPVSTDVAAFAVAHLRQGGGVQVTGSHSPRQCNGMKIFREQAIPISYDSGLANIARIALGTPMRPADRRGRIERRDVLPDWKRHVLSFAKRMDPLHIVLDASNGMAGAMLPLLLPDLPIQVTCLNFEVDGSFPGHEPDPLRPESLRELQRVVLEKGADLGVAFDGDADRCAFVDENGAAVPGDLVAALLAAHLLQSRQKASVVFDIRCSRALAEEIRKFGGLPVRERAGHTFLKAAMRQRNAVFGADPCGRFCWRENYHSESAFIALIELLNLLSRERRSLSEMIRPLRRYCSTGQLEIAVRDSAAAIAAIAAEHKAARIDTLDGLTVEYEDWWFNLRPATRSSGVLLNIEAISSDLLEKKKQALIGSLERFA